MFCSHDVCIAWAHLRLANLELVVHVGIKSVVSSSQPEQNNLLWPVQFVEAVRLVIVWVLLLSFFSWRGVWWWSFHQCKRCICSLVPAGLRPWQAGLLVYFNVSLTFDTSTAMPCRVDCHFYDPFQSQQSFVTLVTYVAENLQNIKGKQLWEQGPSYGLHRTSTSA